MKDMGLADVLVLLNGMAQVVVLIHEVHITVYEVQDDSMSDTSVIT